MRQTKYEYDAFISHAVEDKIPIANELCAKLESAGLRIWYSGKELGIGDSIEKTIEKGLHRSRYGIVILSPTYLAKNWTIREFYTLLAKEIEEHKVILPVLYNVSVDELKQKDLLMADRFAVSADRGLDFVVSKLVAEIRKSNAAEPKVAWFSRMWTLLILSLLANVMFILKGTVFTSSPSAMSAQTSIFPAERDSGTDKLFFEMQRLAGSLNNCTCIPDTGERTVTRQVQLASNRSGPDEQRTGNGMQRGKTNLHAGNKLTMAVVMEIETPGHNGSYRENHVDELIGAADEQPVDPAWISLSEQNRDRTRTARLCGHHTRELAD